MALNPKAGASASIPGTSGNSPLSGLGTGRIARVAVILGKPAPPTPASVAPPEAGRDVGKAIVVCTAPDVCKTPIGSSTPPIPYQITGALGDDANTSQNVYLTGLKAFKFDSVVTHVTGDEPGTATGIQSGTVGDIAEPKTASTVVRVNGQWLVRDGDTFWMNKRNTVGELIYKKDGGNYWPPEDGGGIDDSEAETLLARAQADKAVIEYYESDKEKTGRARIMSAASTASFGSLLRTALDEQPVRLAFLDTSPKGPIVTDAPTWRPPVAMPRTKVPAPTGKGGKGAGWIGVILLLKPIGDHVEAAYDARGVLEGIDPQNPQEQAIYDQALEQLTAYKEGRLNSSFLWIPEYRAFDAEVRTSVKRQIEELRARPQQQQTTTAPAMTPETGGGGGKDGGRITGNKDECEPEPYDENQCSEGEAAHHIIPDFILRVGTRLDPGVRMPGAPSLGKGPSICLNKEDHTQVHDKIAKGMRAKLASNGTITLKDVMDVAIDALDQVKPDCKRQFEQPVRDAFKDVPQEMLGRGMMKTNAELREALTRMWSGE
ncbi:MULTISPECIES: DUF4150 domain-containing protein [Variovorax]|jgi:hypothetical protein|uniref:DUF4150 domain-containing protein n=1 Tax=Variovorax TaxID=34072 RepID=UPI001AD52C0D|nr:MULTISPECIES: DUF4150 domain-containing protein [Variovorax]MBN8757291.1 DUF4150 domain-containing protein [Variovorax sp.]UKI06182.1 DUF4150 domain-containing protein [Variovorax paradoxus]